MRTWKTGCKALVAIGALAGLGSAAQALMIVDGAQYASNGTFGNASGNTTAPGGTLSDFSYWNNASNPYLYLGNQRLLFAVHFGTVNVGGTVNVAGMNYTVLQKDILQDPDNMSPSDLMVIKIDGTPSLPTVKPITSSLLVGEETLMIGSGAKRDTNATAWKINYATNPDTWSVAGSGDTVNARGFLAISSSEKRWGTNTVSYSDADFSTAAGSVTQGFATTFSLDDGNRTIYEAQATNGDSSGSVFVKRDGKWEVAGLMHSIGGTLTAPPFDGDVFSGQPSSPAYSGIYSYTQPGDPNIYSNTTYISDLSRYTSQLVALGVVVPEPSSLMLLAVSTGLLLRRR